MAAAVSEKEGVSPLFERKESCGELVLIVIALALKTLYNLGHQLIVAPAKMLGRGAYVFGSEVKAGAIHALHVCRLVAQGVAETFIYIAATFAKVFGACIQQLSNATCAIAEAAQNGKIAVETLALTLILEMKGAFEAGVQETKNGFHDALVAIRNCPLNPMLAALLLPLANDAKIVGQGIGDGTAQLKESARNGTYLVYEALFPLISELVSMAATGKTQLLDCIHHLPQSLKNALYLPKELLLAFITKLSCYALVGVKQFEAFLQSVSESAKHVLSLLYDLVFPLVVEISAGTKTLYMQRKAYDSSAMKAVYQGSIFAGTLALTAVNEVTHAAGSIKQGVVDAAHAVAKSSSEAFHLIHEAVQLVVFEMITLLQVGAQTGIDSVRSFFESMVHGGGSLAREALLDVSYYLMKLLKGGAIQVGIATERAVKLLIDLGIFTVDYLQAILYYLAKMFKGAWNELLNVDAELRRGMPENFYVHVLYPIAKIVLPYKFAAMRKYGEMKAAAHERMERVRASVDAILARWNKTAV